MCSNFVAKLEVKTKSGDIKYHNSAPVDTNIHSKLGKVSPMSVTLFMCHYFHVSLFPCPSLFPHVGLPMFVTLSSSSLCVKQYFIWTLGGSFVVYTAYIYMCVCVCTVRKTYIFDLFFMVMTLLQESMRLQSCLWTNTYFNRFCFRQILSFQTQLGHSRYRS